MNELTISRNNFQKELEKLRKIDIPSVPNIEKVEEDGEWLYFTHHNVTGKELNERLGDISKSFISTNQAITAIRREFEDVFGVFDVLDKQYIEGINSSLLSSQEALEKVSTAQKDIEKTVKVLGITVGELAKFKVDTLKDIHRLKSEVVNLSDIVSKNVEKLLPELAVNNRRLDNAECSSQSLEQSIKNINKRMKCYAYGIGISLIMNVVLLMLYILNFL